MPSALQLVTRALKINGVLGESETPSTEQATDGLEALNDMLASWSIKRSYIYTIESETFNLVSGTANYTIGVGGDFNTVRPNKIDSLIVNLGQTAFSLTEITPAAYAGLSNKTVNSSIPEYYFIDNDFPLATIHLFGVPQSGLTIDVNYWKPLTTFADLTTVYTLPPGYNRAISYNLAIELAPEHGARISPEAAKVAKDSLANVRNRNLPAHIMATEVGLLNNRNTGYDIVAGD
jgi:hypothetical protein